MASENGSRPSRRKTTSKPHDGNKIRVRAKRLEEIDQTKLTLAYWLLAKRLVEDRTDPRLPTESEVRREASDNPDIRREATS